MPRDPHERLLSSVVDRTAPAALELVDPHALRQGVDDWYGRQRSRTEDLAWAEGFAGHCPVAGVPAEAYLQRVIEVSGAHALIGIRFRGADIDHRFVDIVAFTGDLEDTVAAAFRELSEFEVAVARVRWPGTDPPRVPGYVAELDQWFCAGRLRPPEDSAVQLAPIDDEDAALDFVTRCFRGWAQRTPWFAERVHPVDLEGLQQCQVAGGAFWILQGGDRAGLLCVLPHTDREWTGWVVVEEVLDPAFSGRGIASKAQRVLGRQLGDPVVFGTIDGINAASIRTAERAGRARVGAYWWLWPESSTDA